MYIIEKGCRSDEEAGVKATVVMVSPGKIYKFYFEPPKSILNVSCHSVISELQQILVSACSGVL